MKYRFIMVLAVLFVLPMTVGAQEAVPDAFAILSQVRDTYRQLNSYHFEHQVVVEEVSDAGESARVTALALVTASDAAVAPVDDKTDLLLNKYRCLLTIGTDYGSLTMGCANGAAWRYCSAKQEYMKGGVIEDVMNSVSTKMFYGVHMSPFAIAAEDSIQDATLLCEEMVIVGETQRCCYVIEIILKPSVYMPSQDASTVLPTAFLHALQLHEMFDATDFVLFDQEARPTYKPRTRMIEPSLITLWIDRERNVIVRRTATERAGKRFRNSEGKRVTEEVRLKLDDTFAVINLTQPLPDNLFRFKPPAEAKEIKSKGGRHGYF